MSIAAMALWGAALGNLCSGYGGPTIEELKKKDEEKREKRAEGMYAPSMFSRLCGAKKSKPGDIFEKKLGNLSENEKWLLKYELSNMKISLSQHRRDVLSTFDKYNSTQIDKIIKLYDTDPETAAKIKGYISSPELSATKLLELYKKDEKLFNLLKELGVIQGNFNEMYTINSLDLKYLKPEYAAYKNSIIVKRLDEIASKSPEKAKVVDDITADEKFNYMFTFEARNPNTYYIYSTDDKPEVVDKFVDFYAKDKDFIKRLLTCTNSQCFCNKIESDIHKKETKGKYLEYLVNVLEEFDKLEKKGIDKNQLLDGEMKPFIENRNSKVENIDTLEYLRAKNKETN